ncbi:MULTISPECIES: hypothetical protein [unclassified Rhizobium]|jgi:hypothetical protein|uniref:hypothetical protein n=1 Tax=unclassified Rhizobium TaxID=2613769 RepID=UPI001ADB5289|nr:MULTISPECIES: hypothetical protein [unclassified Rhizobium]MBO9127668.1 hypothetical protein [Rhizobium sp. 16-488-2b]MBO9178130.1 hypothetical protein [Rhizobium sp. 16-488-2a]
MTDIQLEALIALMEKRAEDATKSPDDARRHLMDAGIVAADGTLAPEYAPDDDAEEAAAA